MIASLNGTITRVGSNSVILEAAGVGYLVHVTPSLAASLREGENCRLFTEQIIREDAMTLYGFDTADAHEAFVALISVNGVGPRSALATLATLTIDEIAAAVANEDDAALKKVPGIGPKTAKLMTVQLPGKFAMREGANADAPELLQALVGLGYSEKSARAAIEKTSASGLALSDGLRAALAALSGN